MADIFISYSRRDIAFTRLLFTSLQGSGLDTWIDWERIPIGERWWMEIQQAIENANLFIFIISKHSIGSNVCRDEINIALNNNKRIIPIIIDNLGRESIGKFVPDLKKIQWIIFQNGDTFELNDTKEGKTDQQENEAIATAKRPQFDEAVKKLNAVIHTDWEWVKYHTQLQIEALRWENHEKHASFLLRGEALEQAERLILAAAKKDPLPTTLQAEFITTSRQEEKLQQEEKLRLQKKSAHRLRWVIATVLAGLLIAVFLGINWQAQSKRAKAAESEAILQRDEARQQAQIALSRQLAAQSMNLPFDTAALLSMEAMRFDDSLETRSAFLSILEKQSLHGQYFRGFTGEIIDTAFSEDGKKAAIIDEDVNVKIIDVESKKVIKEVNLQSPSPYPSSPSFSQDLGFAVYVGDSDTIVKYDLVTDEIKQYDLPWAVGWIDNLALSPDGKTIAFSATNLDGKFIHIFNLDQGTTNTKISVELSTIEYIKFSPSGNLLAICGENEVLLWDMAQNQMREVTYKTEEVWRITVAAFDRYEEKMAVAGYGSLIYIFDLESNEIFKVIPVGYNGILSLDFEGYPFRIAFGDIDNKITIWDIFSNQEEGQYLTGHKGEITSLAFSPNQELLSGSSDKTAILWELDSSNQFIGTEIDAFGYHLTYNQDQSQFATFDWSKGIIIWDAQTLEPLHEPLESQAFDVKKFVFSPDGKYLASIDTSDQLIIWDTKTFAPKLIHDASGYLKKIESVVFTPDSQTLFVVVSKDEIATINISDNFELSSFASCEDGECILALSPDGQTLAAISGIFTIELFDINSKLVKDTITLEEIPTSIQFSPDGSVLTIGDTTGAIWFWSITGHQMIGEPISAFKNSVSYIQYNPTGEFIAALSSEYIVTFWDIETHYQIGQELDTQRAEEISFLDDGNTLLSPATTTIKWNLDIDTLKSQVCTMIDRGLTESEWNLYLPGEPYHKTCGN